MTVRWGLLSTARINGAMIGGARKSDRVEVVAVGSRDAARAEAYAREQGIERAHGSYEALLADPGVDAIYISLPNSLHVEWTLRALEAGKHVLVEKPFSRSAAEVEQVFDTAERAGLVVSEAFMWRHHTQTKTLVELVAGGAIGRLRLVRASFSFQLSRPDDVRFRPELDGGSLMDVGCYCVSAARLFGGEPERVDAEQVVGPTGVDVCVAGTLRFPDDVVAHFDCGFILPYRGELELVGEEGVLFAAHPWHPRPPGIELRRTDENREQTVELVPVEPADSYQLQLENVSDAIRGEGELLLGRADAVGQARTIEELYAAAAA